MANMALGGALAPFVAGALFESDMFLTQDFALSRELPKDPIQRLVGNISDRPLRFTGTEPANMFSRELRDPTCLPANATLTGCTVPSYDIEFVTIFSLAPHLFGTACSTVALIAILLFVPLAKPVAAAAAEKDEEAAVAAP